MKSIDLTFKFVSEHEAYLHLSMTVDRFRDLLKTDHFKLSVVDNDRYDNWFYTMHLSPELPAHVIDEIVSTASVHQRRIIHSDDDVRAVIEKLNIQDDDVVIVKYAYDQAKNNATQLISFARELKRILNGRKGINIIIPDPNDIRVESMPAESAKDVLKLMRKNIDDILSSLDS